ncbi:MAG: hypothetical protein H6Q91_2615, partial [Deltaproteobacteria bacterium]|nr:hypothetical protein [Deltaproteobacteria bacterium]
YLTTRGDAVKDTYRMITDAGFEVDGNPLYLEHDEGAVHFEIPGGGAEVLRPEIAARKRGPAARVRSEPQPSEAQQDGSAPAE